MALPTVEETRQFVKDTLRSEMDPAGTGAFNDRPGSDTAKLESVLIKVATKQYAYSADRKRASIGATATGKDLADHVRDVYFDAPKGASFAVGTVYLHRSTGPLGATQFDEGTRFSPKTPAARSPNSQ
jgi:hypothetical protein